MKLKIVAISDLHGKLPAIPECDLLLIGGDICPCRGSQQSGITFQSFWLRGEFEPWLRDVPAKHVVATWGNHDWIGERAPERVRLPWTMLVDQSTELFGLKIYGTPWQPVFFDWAFNLTEPQLERKWAAIPDDTDILLLHGPPHGIGDMADSGHVGSPSLRRRVSEVKPRLAVFGHIHSGYGVYEVGGSKLVNASLLDESYRMVNAPHVIELDI